MRSKLCWLPVALTACSIVAFSTSYVWAVLRNDVYPWWPYISDAGTTIPESCVFGQLLNLSACFAAATMYVRYKLVQAFDSHDRCLSIMNGIGLASGLFSALGVSLVANFQESSVLIVHIIGALTAFIPGVAYCFIQTAISRKMYPMYSGFTIYVVRFCISALGLLTLVSTGVFGMWAMHLKGTDSNFTVYEWKPNDPGFDEHVVSTVSEWAMGLAFLVFFLTYVKDFQKISMRLLPELLVSHLDETPVIFSTNGHPTERTGLLA